MKKYLLINTMALAMVGCGGGSSSTPASSSVAASVQASIPASIAASSQAASSIAPAKWNLVWSDEFDGTNLDTTKWSYEKNCVGGYNDELQCYTDRADNTFLADGKLHLVAKKEPFSGQAKGDDEPSYNPGDTSAKRDYTSARLRTKGKGDWTYGRVEIRAKLPKGQGMWPAIWMLPTEWKYGGWPASGEIDIMEAVNPSLATGPNENKPNNIFGTLHYGTPWSHPGAAIEPATNVWDAYHTYTVEWEAGTIRWYVDDTHYATQISKNWFTSGSASPHAPFDQKFHLILNLAVGGKWPGNPNPETTFPQEMTVEFVKIYNCSADAVTGTGCASNVNPAIKPLAGTPKNAEGELSNTFNIFDDAVDPIWTQGLDKWDNNSGSIKPTVVDSADPARGKVINVKYTGKEGLAYIQSKTILDASAFAKGGYLKFDLKVLSYGDASGINVKSDCVHPCTSGDIDLGKVADNKWETIKVPISQLVSGGLNLSRLNTPIGISPKGTQTGVEIELDNISWVLEDEVVTPPTGEEFPKMPYVMFGDSLDAALKIGSYNPKGVITQSNVAVEGRGQVFNVVKTGADGNVYFEIVAGASNLQHLTDTAVLVFDVMLNKASDAKLLVKIDSVWPNVSDVTVPVTLGSWSTFKISVADLIKNRNSIDSSGIVNIAKITNIFVIEPSAAMDVSFDNIHFEAK